MITLPAVLKSAAFAAILIGVTGCQNVPAVEQSSAPLFGETFTPVDAVAQNAAMGGGVNVLGYDPVWREPGKARFVPEHFRVIREAGFKNVRVVLQAFDFIDGSGKLDPRWLATLDGFVKVALDQGLTVILDEHDFTLCGKDTALCRTKLDAFWSTIAPHYKDASNRLVFEILNEPHEALTAEVWNKQLVESLAIIRASNPTRNVIIGPGNWNGLEFLPKLELPMSDQHIIVTVHYYHPMSFTHQGASWVPQYEDKLGVTWGSAAEIKLLNDELDDVKAWSLVHKRPIFLGEFGAYDKAAMTDRAKWDGAVARAAEARGFSWAYWQFDPDFVLWDFSKPGWVEPILNALIPSTNKTNNKQ
jgi:endoglucanase